MSTPNAPYQEALTWMAQLETAEDIESHWPQFEAWLEQSAQHGELYQRLETARAEAARIGQLLQAQGLDEEALAAAVWLQFRPSRWHTASFVGWPLGAAAALLLLIGFGIAVHSSWVHYQTQQTVRTVTFPDGSVVTLDVDTALRVRLSLWRRDLVLERGRALFEPRHDGLRPFEVRVDRAVVRPTGTKFEVDRRGDTEFEAAVLQGEVQVNLTDDPQHALGTRATLSAGQVLRIHRGGVSVRAAAPHELDHRLAWVAGRIEWEGTLEQVVQEFNRYNLRRLVIDDPDLRALPIAGGFDAHSPDLFARTLEQTHHIAHRTVLPPGSPQGEIHLSHFH